MTTSVHRFWAADRINPIQGANSSGRNSGGVQCPALARRTHSLPPSLPPTQKLRRDAVEYVSEQCSISLRRRTFFFSSVVISFFCPNARHLDTFCVEIQNSWSQPAIFMDPGSNTSSVILLFANAFLSHIHLSLSLSLLTTNCHLASSPARQLAVLYNNSNFLLRTSSFWRNILTSELYVLNSPGRTELIPLLK